MRKKAAIVGVFGEGPDFTTGQAVKCRELILGLRKKYGDSEIEPVNTYRWKKTPFRLLEKLIASFFQFNNIIIMPAQHGICVFAPIAFLMKKATKRSVHYVVIGGWLAETLKHKKWLRYCVKSFDALYVETKSMVQDLNALGLKQVFYMPNFRELPNSSDTLQEKNFSNGSVPVCTYSRVVKEKGIEDAIQIVNTANQLIGKEKFHLDIYGPIAEAYRNEFAEVLLKNQDVAEYRGVKNAGQGVETLSKYFALLFPTYYEGEGFAGTLLDAFASGTPAIVNDWKYNREIVESGTNGFVYPYRDIVRAAQDLCKLYEDPHLYRQIQEGCRQSSRVYSTEHILEAFERRLI